VRLDLMAVEDVGDCLEIGGVRLQSLLASIDR
jgi:hypothetical protein